MTDLCESAKKGRCCPDDLCHGAEVTLCGFDKEFYEREIRYYDDEDEDGLWECYEPEDGDEEQ